MENFNGLQKTLQKPQLHPILQLRNTQICQYTGRCTTKKIDYSRHTENFRAKKTYSGKVTEGIRKKIIRCVDILAQITPKRVHYNIFNQAVEKPSLSFITLTLPRDISKEQEKESYEKLLKPFIRWLVRSESTKHYVWRAEKTKNGRLHYHLVINQFIKKEYIQRRWNKILFDNQLLNQYLKDHGNIHAPSTHIVSVKSNNHVAAYIAKYVGKKETNSKHTILCKLWGCSLNLKGVKYFSVDDATYLNYAILKSAPKKIYVFWNEYVNIIQCNVFNFLRNYAPDILAKYSMWKNAIYNNLSIIP